MKLTTETSTEVEVGKDWMDRAKEAGATEENVHEEDKKKYHAFCFAAVLTQIMSVMVERPVEVVVKG